ncbi:MAG: hypothetical protein ACRDDM_01695, partial [Paraclostridium sp.]
MISILKKEPVLRKLVAFSIISVFFIFSLFTIFQYENLKGIYLEQNNINERLIGMLVSKYPESEVDIVKSIYSENNEYEDLGNKTLNKFGYSKDYDMKRNINFQKHLKYFLVNNLAVFVILIGVIIGIVSNLVKYVFRRLEDINKDIGNIIHNKYIVEDDFKEEGIFNRIYSDLNKLSRSLNLKVSTLD